MGRQISFWMSAADEMAFIERLLRDDVVWVPYALPLGARPVAHELDVWPSAEKALRRVLIRRAQWDQLAWLDVAENPLPNHRPDGFVPWTMVGVLASPAFEWRLCRRGADYIRCGRIYYSTEYFDGAHVHNKPEEPGKWFDRLTRWLRSRGRKHKSVGRYLMAEAAAAYDAGQVQIRY